jgi:uncharacterized protein (DUF58 family)
MPSCSACLPRSRCRADVIPTLRLILLVLFAAPLIALATWWSPFLWAAGVYLLFISALAYSDWRLARDARRFEVARLHEGRLSLGADNPITLQVRNQSGLPVDFMVRDEIPTSFNLHLPETEVPLLEGHVTPRAIWQGVYRVRPSKRGDFHFGDLSLRWRGPLGLVMRQARLPSATPVKVYPNLLDVRRFDLLLRRNRLQEMGLRQARVFGEGTEFDRLRDYLPDDPYRRINWKATARHHRPITVEYQTERRQDVIAVLDTGRMMQSPVAQIAKLDHVINAVLLLAYVVTGKGDRVGLLTFADDVRGYLSPRPGRGQFYRMLASLYAVEPEPVEPDYRRALSYLGLKHRRRALVVIFTDLEAGASLDALASQVAQLARRSLPLVVTISDPDVYAAAWQRPGDSLEAYQRVYAAQLLDDRRLILEGLHRHGVMTLDVPADRLSMSVINRYLELKARTLL